MADINTSMRLILPKNKIIKTFETGGNKQTPGLLCFSGEKGIERVSSHQTLDDSKNRNFVSYSEVSTLLSLPSGPSLTLGWCCLLSQ